MRTLQRIGLALVAVTLLLSILAFPLQGQQGAVDPNVQAVLTRVDSATAALARSFNVAAPEVWRILVKQAYVNFYTALVAVVISAAISATGLWTAVFLAPKMIYSRDSEEAYYGLGLGLALVLGVCLGTALIALVANTPDFLNPEHYALNRLLELVK